LVYGFLLRFDFEITVDHNKCCWHISSSYMLFRPTPATGLQWQGLLCSKF
jgi:hypothetical protein